MYISLLYNNKLRKRKEAILKILNSLTKSAMGFLRFLGVILILAILIFVIKWRTNHLFSLLSPETEQDTTIVEELQSSKEQIEELTTAAKTPKEETILLKLTSSDLDTISQALKKEGLIQDPTTFSIQSRMEGFEPYFTKGTFEIPKDAKVKEIQEILTKNGYEKARRSVKIEIPEGVDSSGISTILKKEGLIQDSATFTRMIDSQNALPRIKPGGYSIQAPIKAQELLDTLAPPLQGETEQESPVTQQAEQ